MEKSNAGWSQSFWRPFSAFLRLPCLPPRDEQKLLWDCELRTMQTVADCHETADLRQGRDVWCSLKAGGRLAAGGSVLKLLSPGLEVNQIDSVL